MSNHLFKALAYADKRTSKLTFDLVVPWSRVKGAFCRPHDDTSVLIEGFSPLFVTMPLEEFEKQLEAYLTNKEKK